MKIIGENSRNQDAGVLLGRELECKKPSLTCARLNRSLLMQRGTDVLAGSCVVRILRRLSQNAFQTKGLKSPLHSDLNQVSNWNRFVGVMEENWKNHLIAWVSFFRRRKKMTRNRFALVSASAIVALMSLGLSIPIIQASGNTLKLAPTSGSLTPSDSGELSFSLSRGVLSGKAETEDLLPQGAHLAYFLWFVNTDICDQAFVG